jgi:hypothetical protein
MSISLSCDGCGRAYRVNDDLAGKRIKCKDCGEPIMVPSSVTLARRNSLLDDDDEDDEVIDALPPKSSATIRTFRSSSRASEDTRDDLESTTPAPRSRGRRAQPAATPMKAVAVVVGGLVALVVVVGLITGQMAVPQPVATVPDPAGTPAAAINSPPPPPVGSAPTVAASAAPGGVAAGTPPAGIPTAAPVNPAVVAANPAVPAAQGVTPPAATTGTATTGATTAGAATTPPPGTAAAVAAVDGQKPLKNLATAIVSSGDKDLDVPWTVKADPPPTLSEAVTWPAKLSLKVAGESDNMVFINPLKPLVFQSARKGGGFEFRMTDLLTGAVLGEGETHHPLDRDLTISPSGEQLAIKVIRREGEAVVSDVVVLAVKDGRPLAQLSCGGVGRSLQHFGFGPDGVLIMYTLGSEGDKKSVGHLMGVDWATGNVLWDVVDPRRFYQYQTAYSPTGRYVASVQSEEVGAFVFDLQTGAIVGRIKLQFQDENGNRLSPQGIAFSPDGQRIAVLQASLTNTEVTIVEMETGKPLQSLKMIGQFTDVFRESLSYNGPKLDWMTDGSGVVLAGVGVIDLATGRLIFRLELLSNPQFPLMTNNVHRLWTGQGVLVAEGPQKATKLKVMPIDWDGLRELAQLVESPESLLSDDDVVVCPGKPVQLKIEVGQLRGGNAAATETALINGMTQRLQLDGIEVDFEQPTMLAVRYNESAGAVLQESVRRPGQIFGGTPTGKTVESTKAILQFAYCSADGKKVYWSDFIQFDPSFLILAGEANGAAAREAMFKALLEHLQGASLPYLLTKSKNGRRLPAVAELAFQPF